MGVNLDKPQRRKQDTQLSVDYYNNWFLNFAPSAYQETRARAALYVENILRRTNNLRSITADVLLEHPDALEMLRMSTAPPIARDRLVGLAQVSKSLVENMEKNRRIPRQMPKDRLRQELERMSITIARLIDQDVFTWLESGIDPDTEDIRRAATVVADRLCGMLTDPLIRNAQEKRQLDLLTAWLEVHSYLKSDVRNIHQMQPGTYAQRVNVPTHRNGNEAVNIPIDMIVMPRAAIVGDLPLLIEAKSAGDFANTNKRRKEEATKMRQLRHAFGENIHFIRMLGGYFDSGYLGYEAAEGIDWFWEHRLDDLAEFGL
jgi:hypothetical protein